MVFVKLKPLLNGGKGRRIKRLQTEIDDDLGFFKAEFDNREVEAVDLIEFFFRSDGLIA